MSILIKKLFGKDMPMPQEGYIDVRLHFKGGKIECATMQTGESPFYATFDVEEVPTPNGRLIDADKLMRDIEEYHLSDGKFQHWVEVQQTIIEVEGSET